MAADPSSARVLDERDDWQDLLASPEESWAYFDGVVRHRLGISADAFLAGVQDGVYVNDDANAAVAELFMLLDIVPPRFRG